MKLPGWCPCDCRDLETPRLLPRPASSSRPAQGSDLPLDTGFEAERCWAALIEAAREEDALPGEADEYGKRYTVDFLMTRGYREARVWSAWIILHGESAPRLTSCFVL
jgi:hypothetical protein